MRLKPSIINLGIRKKPGSEGMMVRSEPCSENPGKGNGPAFSRKCLFLYDFYLFVIFFNWFFFSFQHKTCLKSSRSEKSMSVRLAVLEFHTSAFFFFFHLPYVWRKKHYTAVMWGEWSFIHVLVKASVCIKCTLSIHIQRTVCESVCVCMCIWSDIMLKVLCLFFLFALGRLGSVPTLWPPGTGSPEGRV